VNADHRAVIVNPAAGGGRTGDVLGGLREKFFSAFGENTTVSCTRKAGEAADLARHALQQGVRHLVIVGGDGTIHEVVNGAFSLDAKLAAQVSFSIISTGTGCGLARSLGMPSSIDRQLELIGHTTVRSIDLGRATLEAQGRSCWFVSECQVGIGAEVVKQSSRSRKAFGGSFAYALTAIPLLLRYPNPDVELSVDRAERRQIPMTGIAIGNGAITGGGMRLTPNAVLNDGLLDVLIIKGQSAFQRLRNMANVSSGTHIHSPNCDYFQARNVAIASGVAIPVSADGECVGTLPAQFESWPQMFHVHCPPDR
jgi:diacylglycerol kinase (ATP)